MRNGQAIMYIVSLQIEQSLGVYIEQTINKDLTCFEAMKICNDLNANCNDTKLYYHPVSVICL